MATENDLVDVKVRAWRALATLLETLNEIAAKASKQLDRELEGGAGERRGRS